MKNKSPNGFTFNSNNYSGNKNSNSKNEYDDRLSKNAVEKLFKPENDLVIGKNTDDYKDFFSNYTSTGYKNFIERYEKENMSVDEENGVYRNNRRARKNLANSNLKKETKNESYVYAEYHRPVFPKVMAIGIITILLCVTGMLVYKNYMLSSEVSILRGQMNEKEEDSQKLQIATIENEKLKQKIKELEATQIGNQQGNEIIAETQSEITTQENTQQTPSENTYVVQKGDTLSSISKKFYGTTTLYQKIMDANNLTSENLSQDQTLIIPAK